MFKEHTICRACGNTDLIQVADFGVQPLANDFKKPGEVTANKYPLKVLFCEQCTLAQLSVVVHPKTLYSNYSYVTSPSKTMVAHFEALSHYAYGLRISHNLGSVLEIGSNNGAFLKWLVHWKFTTSVQGIEPAERLAVESNKNDIQTDCAFWNTRTASRLKSKFDTVFARHVFAHCDDWKEFIQALEIVTHNGSTVFIEVPSARDTIDRGEFDQIYHEHLSYVTTPSIQALLKDTQFYLHTTKRFPIHGGSIVFVLKRRPDNPIPFRTSCFEIEAPVTAEDWILLNVQKETQSAALICKVAELRQYKRRIFGFGASAKATLCAQLSGLSSRSIEFIHDDTPQKQGCFLPGTDIPIIDGAKRINKMDVCVIFAWNFEEEIREKLSWWNGTFLVPGKLPLLQKPPVDALTAA